MLGITRGYPMKNLLLITAAFFLFSCTQEINENPALLECPEALALKALEYAVEYSNADTEYFWGGRDDLRSIKIDCSGLVLNCYKYAVNGTGCSLPFSDSTVATLFSKWTVPTNSPRPGDLIFMGDDKSNPSHVSLYAGKDDENIYFIDSTLKADDDINGVTERFYPIGDDRFLSFGALLVLGNG